MEPFFFVLTMIFLLSKRLAILLFLRYGIGLSCVGLALNTFCRFAEESV